MAHAFTGRSALIALPGGAQDGRPAVGTLRRGLRSAYCLRNQREIDELLRLLLRFAQDRPAAPRLPPRDHAG